MIQSDLHSDMQEGIQVPKPGCLASDTEVGIDRNKMNGPKVRKR